MIKLSFWSLLLLVMSTSLRASTYSNYPLWYSQYDIHYYKIDVEIDNIKSYVKGRGTIEATVLIEKLDTFRFELSLDLNLDSVFIAGKKVKFNRKNNEVAAVLIQQARTGENITMQAFYRGEVVSKGFFTPLSCKSDFKWKQPATWTLSEPYGAMYWFPCKQDPRDKADSASIFVTVPIPLKAGSAGRLTRVVQTDEDHQRYEWNTHYPIAYYLISFCVSDFREYNFYAQLDSGDSVFVQNYIYNNPDFLPEQKENIDQTSPLLNFYSTLFCKYPFASEKYGHCMAPLGGGMENQSMTSLSNFDFNLVAHEMAHQWFGDMVTCANFHDIWLNEGFASYCEYLSLDKLKSHTKAQNWMVEAHRMALREPEGAVFVDDISEANQYRIFSYGLTYKKGGVLLHMLRKELNDDSVFFTILRKYLDTYKYSSASVSDFVSILNKNTGQDYSWFFSQWFYGKGYPVFDVSWKQENDTLNLLITQKPSAEKGPFFRTRYDLKINLAHSDTLLSFYMDTSVQYFRSPMPNYIRSIEFDPEHWLLKKVNVDKVPDIPLADNEIEVTTPFVSEINVSFKKPPLKKRTVRLTDCSGTVFLNVNIKKKQKFMLETTSLPSGTYMLYISEGKRTFVKKLIKPQYPNF